MDAYPRRGKKYFLQIIEKSIFLNFLFSESLVRKYLTMYIHVCVTCSNYEL